jgi:hypothetical protein
MDAKKRKKLEKMGGRVTTVQELFGLTDAEVATIDAAVDADIAKRTRGTRQRTAKKAKR